MSGKYGNIGTKLATFNIMTNSSATNVQPGKAAASSAITKKAKKQLSASGLAELFSQISQQPNPGTKTKFLSFKKILEPVKANSGVTKAQSEDLPKKKTAQTADQIICVPCAVSTSNQVKTNKKIQISLPNRQSVPGTEKRNTAAEGQSGGTEPLPQPNFKPTIDPRSPMHGLIPGNKDADRVLITDGPKAKTNEISKTTNVFDHKTAKVNIASQADVKLIRPAIESSAASNNPLIGSTEIKFQNATVPVPPQRTDAIAGVEKNPKKPAAKVNPKDSVNVIVNNEDSDSKDQNPTEKQSRLNQVRTENPYKKLVPELAGSGMSSEAAAKAEARVTSMPEIPVAQANANPPGTNPGTAVNQDSKTGNLHEQIISVASAASYKIGQKITVNLNPPELGRISIKLEKNGDEIIGRLEVEKVNTKNQIDFTLTQITQNLQDSGIQLKHIEVVLQEQSLQNHQQFAQQAQPDWEQKSHFGAEKNYGDNHLESSDNEQISYDQHGDIHISEKSINILV